VSTTRSRTVRADLEPLSRRHMRPNCGAASGLVTTPNLIDGARRLIASGKSAWPCLARQSCRRASKHCGP